MNKKLKGFTLLELIIVMAIFSVLMIAALQLVDPVEKVMNNTSVQEKNASYVDNMQDYLKSSMKYSEFINVYEGDFCKLDGSTTTAITEQEAVEEFVRKYFDGRVNSSYNLVDGKIRVLKIDNETDGKIYEDVWSFTAGDTYIHETENPSDPSNPIKTTVELTAPNLTLVSTGDMAINPDYYKDYNFYFKLGYNDFSSLSDSDLSNYTPVGSSDTLSPDPQAKYYYGELTQGLDYNGNAVPFGQNNFSISVVTYEKGNKISCVYDDGTTTSNKIVFKSPFYMSSSNMALLNVISNDHKYYQIVQDNDGNTEYDTSGNKKLELTDGVTSGIKGLPFEYLKYDTGENIYFIYALSSEINY